MPTKTLIIIPARSGSKGIPEKNIKLLGGKPLLAWTAEAIHAAEIPKSMAVLSTDSIEYASLGRDLGLQAPFIRPQGYALDQTSTIAVAEHALQWFKQAFDYLPEQVMILQPTSPFRSPDIIKQAIHMMATQQADGVVGCKTIQRDLTTLFKLENDYLKPLCTNQPTQTSRQSIMPLLTPNGAMYLCKTTLLHENKSVYAERTLPLVMNEVMSLDLDTLEDWAIAEAMAQASLHLAGSEQ